MTATIYDGIDFSGSSNPETDDPGPSALLGRIRTGAWLDAQDFPPLRWAVQGVIPEGFGLLVGPPKLGKSWFVLGISLAIAVGGRAFGRIDVEQRPVLYAALEDGDRRMQSRCRKLLAGEPIPAAFQYVTTASPLEIFPMIGAWLEQNPDGVVALDTLGKVMQPAAGGESAYSRDYRVGGQLKSITDAYPGSTLLVVHHDRKARGGDWMDSTSGTQGLNGSADFTILLERARNEGDATLKVTGRDVTENEYAMTVTDGSWSLGGATLAAAAAAAREATSTAGLGDRSSEIVRIVSQHPQGIGPTAVAIAVGIEPKDAAQYLGRLEKAGRISKAGRGQYTPVVSVDSVVSDPDDPPPYDAYDGYDTTPDTLV